MRPSAIDRVLEQAADNGCTETAKIEASIQGALLSLLPEHNHQAEYSLPAGFEIIVSILVGECLIETKEDEFVGPVLERSKYQLTDSGKYVAWELFMHQC